MNVIDPFPLADDADLAEQTAQVVNTDDGERPDFTPVGRIWDADIADRIDQSIPVPIFDDRDERELGT